MKKAAHPRGARLEEIDGSMQLPEASKDFTVMQQTINPVNGSVQIPAADRGAIQTYLDAVFKRCPPGWLAIRAFDQHDRSLPPAIAKGFRFDPAQINTLANAIGAEADHAAGLARATCFAPPPAIFDTKDNARGDNILAAPAIVVDLDGGDPARGLDLLEGILGPATIVLFSGGVTERGNPKLHSYWRLAKPADREEALGPLRRARWIAAALADGDATAASPVHPMRWPGSIHRKAAPKLATIARIDAAREVDLAAALQALEDAGDMLGIQAPAGGASGTGPEDLAAWPRVLNDMQRKALVLLWFQSVPNIGFDAYADFRDVMLAAKGACGPSLAADPEIEDAFCDWAFSWQQPTKGDPRQQWRSAAPRHLGWARLRRLAEEREAQHPSARAVRAAETMMLFAGTPGPLALLTQPAPAKPTMTATKAMDLATRAPAPPQQFVLDGLIPAGMLTLIAGPAGVGKTFLTQEIAAHVATGAAFGPRATTPGGVLLLYSEDGSAQNDRRARAIEAAFGMPLSTWGGVEWISCDDIDDGAPDDDPNSVLFVCNREGRLEPTWLWRWLVERIKQTRPALVILDNANSLIDGEQNGTSTITHYLDRLRRLTRYGTAVVLLHHPPKSKEHAFAGSQAYINKPRVVLQLDYERDDKGNQISPDRVRLVSIKSNVGPVGERLDFLRMSNGVLFPVTPPSASTPPALLAIQHQQAILDGLAELSRQGRYASPSPQAKDFYAERVLTTTSACRVLGMGAREVRSALSDLLSGGVVKVDDVKTGKRNTARAYVATGVPLAPPFVTP